jgi:hypothetical protein
MKIACADFESVRLANGKSLVHNISVVTGTLEHKKLWTSQGRGKTPQYINSTVVSGGPRIDIVVRSSLKHPSIELSENIQNKLRLTEEFADKYNFEKYAVPDLRTAVRLLIKFVNENTDGIFMSHSLDNDLRILFESAEVLGEKKLFKKDFLCRPEVGCYLSGWDKLTLICTQRLFTTQCPKFDKEVAATQPDTRLESYARNIYGPDYEQTHTSVADALDLMFVICKAFSKDKFKIDLGKSRLFMKPVWRARNQACTS